MNKEEIPPRLAIGRQLLQLPGCHPRWTMDDGRWMMGYQVGLPTLWNGAPNPGEAREGTMTWSRGQIKKTKYSTNTATSLIVSLSRNTTARASATRGLPETYSVHGAAAQRVRGLVNQKEIMSVQASSHPPNGTLLSDPHFREENAGARPVSLSQQRTWHFAHATGSPSVTSPRSAGGLRPAFAPSHHHLNSGNKASAVPPVVEPS